MAIDISAIQLSDAERRLLAEVAEQTGKPWPVVLDEALSSYRQALQPNIGNGHGAETVHDALRRTGLLGCLKGGPRDLSTNLKHMEGFGEDGR